MGSSGQMGNSGLSRSKLETTQINAESTPEIIKESYQRALGG